MKTYFSLLILFLIFCCSVMYVGLGGEFPLNDDWMYSYPVKTLFENGSYELNGEAAPYLFFQVFVGWLFTEVTGAFSFSTLRLCTLTFSLIGVLAFFKWMQLNSGEKWMPFITTILLFFNPLYFNLGFSFMTDVPFAALLILALWHYQLFFENKNNTHRFLGGLFSILGFLIRQPGIMVFVLAEGIFLFSVFGKRKFLRNLIVVALVLMSLFFGIEIILKQQLGIENKFVNTFDTPLFTDPIYWGGQLVKRYLMASIYFGLFFMPMMFGLVPEFFQKRFYKKKRFLSALFLSITLSSILYFNGRIFPYGGNVFYNFGLGTPVASDFYNNGIRSFTQLPIHLVTLFGVVVQTFSFLLIFKLGNEIFKTFKKTNLSQMDILVISFLGVYSFLMFSFTFFDRYVLPIFIMGIYLLIRFSPRLFKLNFRTLIGISLFALFSIFGTKDYLAWNQAILEAKDQLIKNGIKREDICAGVAQNGWDLPQRRNEEAEYWIGWGLVPEFEVIGKVPYKKYLLGKGELFILKIN